MAAIKINTYDYNIDPIENLKGNFLADRLAKNRWGKKFARLYKKNATPTADGTIGIYDFTLGMRSAVYTLSEYETTLASALDFRTKLYNNLEVSDGTIWSVGYAAPQSYMVVLLEGVSSSYFSNASQIKGMHFSLSLAANSGDGRKISWFRSSGEDGSTATTLLPLFNAAESYGLHLVSSDGLAYGHYDGGLRAGTLHNTALGMYGVQNTADARFRADQDARFSAIWAELLVYAQKMVSHLSPSVVGERVSVLVGLGQLLDFMDRYIVTLEDAIDGLSNSPSRAEEDMALMNHLGIVETIQEQVTDPGEVERIWFRMEKQIGSAAPGYEWWMEPQFDEIRSHVKDFHLHCTVDDHLFATVARVNSSVFDLAGWKIFYFVSAFLDVGVDMEDPSFWEQVLNVVLAVVAIVLILITKNPIWLKIILITTTVLSYAGVLSPEISLLIAALSFSYGLYSVDFSSLSGMQMFNFAIKNVSMVVNMIGTYESIGIQKEMEAQAKHDNEKKSMAQMQDESMEYIYSDAYSQYDMLYSMLYNFEPKYRT